MSETLDQPLFYAANIEEFFYLVNYAGDRDWIERDIVEPSLDEAKPVERKHRFTLTPAGWEEARRQPRIESEKAFVAMWFNKSMDDAYSSGIAAAVRDDCGFRPVRIDVEEHNDDIVDRVLAEINESRFVVADLTEHRNGVYFEAGYAKGLGIPVIWTCREGDADGTHFDAEHFNQIRWTTPADLRKKLQARIRATIGRGPLLIDEHAAEQRLMAGEV